MKEGPSSTSCRCCKKFISLIMLIAVMLSLAACSNEELENNLYNQKTVTVGDTKKAEKIASSLEYTKNYTFDSIKVIRNQAPYGLNIYLKESVPKLSSDFSGEAVVIFSLIDDINSINFISEKRGEILDSYNREDIDRLLENNYHLDTKKIGSNKKEFNYYLSIKKVD